MVHEAIEEIRNGRGAAPRAPSSAPTGTRPVILCPGEIDDPCRAGLLLDGQIEEHARGGRLRAAGRAPDRGAGERPYREIPESSIPMRAHLIALSLALAAIACQSTSSPTIVKADPAKREPLLSAVSALAGRWAGEAEGETKYTEFEVIAAGTAVRENMLQGEPHEMTNMYTLDGNSLVMTHYCASGNQPRMRATGVEDGKIEFRADGVADLESGDETYMGAMTLEIVDDDHIVQHWKALQAGQPDQEMLIELTRVK